MGKRKATKPQPKRKQEKLATIFTCPFCNHVDSVECKMDRKKMKGQVGCNICKANYCIYINNLSEPIDVYTAWIDACEEANS